MFVKSQPNAKKYIHDIEIASPVAGARFRFTEPSLWPWESDPSRSSRRSRQISSGVHQWQLATGPLSMHLRKRHGTILSSRWIVPVLSLSSWSSLISANRGYDQIETIIVTSAMHFRCALCIDLFFFQHSQPGQSCLWFNQGCTIGCPCTGNGTNSRLPNFNSCDTTMKPTNNDPNTRTLNRGAVAGSPEDVYKFMPWRAPG